MQKVAVLSMDLANEGTIRCALIAQALKKHYDVEIIGPLWRRPNGLVEPLWPQFRELDIPIRSAVGKGWPGFVITAVQLLRLIRADAVIACKPRPGSFGIALLKKMISGTPVILDVDDDEIAITKSTYKKGRWLNIGHPNGYRATQLIQRLRQRADAVTCVSGRFQREFGGVIAPHGRDPKEYDPAKVNGSAVRNTLGLTTDQIVLGFIGTPRRMKGIHVLLEAMDQLTHNDLKLLIVGFDRNASYAAPILAQCGDRLVAVPPVPMHQVPPYIAASDIIVLPQINSPMTSGQMPAKLTDAMAMAKPIIASATSDIPRYLEGSGILVTPEDVDELAKAIAWMAENPDEARELGKRARERFLKDMTTDYLFTVLDAQIQSVLSKD